MTDLKKTAPFFPNAKHLKVWQFGNTFVAYMKGYSKCYGKTEQEARLDFFVEHII